MDGLITDQEKVKAWESSWKYSFAGMAIVNPDFTFRSVNAQWLKLLGVPAFEFYGNSFQDITPQEIRRIDAEQAELVKLGKIDSYLLHKDYIFSTGQKKKVTLLVTRVPVNTEEPFQFFLSRIMLRENLEVKQSQSGSSSLTSKEKALQFIKDYFYWIVISTAAITGVILEWYGML